MPGVVGHGSGPGDAPEGPPGNHARRDATGRIRRPGAGRPRLEQRQPGLLAALEGLVDPLTRGDPTSPLRWTCKSRAKLASGLAQQGWRVSSTTVGRLLHQLGYRLQSARKRQEGTSHPDRNAQFEHINATADSFLAEGQPVISVDTKKKELVGNFKNGGREWQPKGTPPAVLVHDFPTDAEGKAIPYGVYDMARNEAWVSVGRDHDTPAFAVASIRHWWQQMGCDAYPDATALFITADAGGSNGYRLRAWKHELQQLADETRLTIHVSHFPPGTSKWNKIEHRLFCHITANWRGTPLTTYETIVDRIGNTRTETGLWVRAELNAGQDPTGVTSSLRDLDCYPDEVGKFISIPSPSAAATTSAQRRALASLLRIPAMKRSPALTASSRPRSRATCRTRRSRPRRRARWRPSPERRGRRAVRPSASRPRRRRAPPAPKHERLVRAEAVPRPPRRDWSRRVPEAWASESMAAAFCALFAPGDGGVVMQPCAGSVLAAELSLG